MTDPALAAERAGTWRVDSAAQMKNALASVGYLADERDCAVLWLAAQLGKPVLVEGPAGTGKTELATSMAAATSRQLIRLQCYEGLDEAKALYEWNHQKQLLRLLADRAGHTGPAGRSRTERTTVGWEEAGIFTEEFLLSRPLLNAITATQPVVLLIDEADRLDVEAEAFLLEILSDYQISIPELGTVVGRQVPTVFLTSKGSRNLTEALRRRCLYLYLTYPSPEREREIVRTRVPGVPEHLAGQIAAFVGSLRRLELRQRPSVSRTLEWARTLLALGVQDLNAGLAAESLPVLLSYRADLELAAARLAIGGPPPHS
jgi:MoxR-like ATPase